MHLSFELHAHLDTRAAARASQTQVKSQNGPRLLPCLPDSFSPCSPSFWLNSRLTVYVWLGGVSRPGDRYEILDCETSRARMSLPVLARRFARRDLSPISSLSRSKLQSSLYLVSHLVVPRMLQRDLRLLRSTPCLLRTIRLLLQRS